MDETTKGTKVERKLFTKEMLLSITMPTAVIEPPGFDYALRIRGLNALEQSRVTASMVDVQYSGGQTRVAGKLEGGDALICSLGVEEPKLTFAEWGRMPHNLVHFAADQIREISGMNITQDEAAGN